MPTGSRKSPPNSRDADLVIVANATRDVAGFASDVYYFGCASGDDAGDVAVAEDAVHVVDREPVVGVAGTNEPQQRRTLGGPDAVRLSALGPR